MNKYIVKTVLTLTFTALIAIPADAQTGAGSGRIGTCMENYRTLFGGEALTGEGTDPELMAMLQKFIFGEVFATGELTIKQRELITCTALATMQTLPQLKAHTAAALNVGVKPVELREAMYLTAPFIGFPKTLNAVAAVNEVFGEHGIKLPLDNMTTVTDANRHERGKEIQERLYGSGMAKVMADIPGNMGDSVARYLTDYFFGETYTRGALDLKTRELLGYCVLATIGADSQLHSHYHGNLKAGNKPETVAAAIVQCLPYIGFPAAIKALRIIKEESHKTENTGERLVRLSLITVNPDSLEAYNAMLREEIEASLRIEPGVITLYAMAEKDAPNKITILETYANRAAYERHLKTPHFIKYKQGTLKMVENLKLLDTTPLVTGFALTTTPVTDK